MRRRRGEKEKLNVLAEEARFSRVLFQKGEPKEKKAGKLLTQEAERRNLLLSLLGFNLPASFFVWQSQTIPRSLARSGICYNLLMPVDLSDIRPRMEKAFEVVRNEVSSIRTGRATSALVENIVCLVYGGTQRLKVVELGTITTPDPNTILIQPWDISIIGEIKQGIEAANVGLVPIIDGQVIRIAVPSLSAERRQEYVKLLHRHLENGRVMVRQVRHDKMVDIKRAAEAKEFSEDDRFRMEEELQKLTDEFIGKIDEMGKRKEEELLLV